jgi:hypothetical protein
MQLNPEGRARLQAHLQNALRQPCAVCGSGNWQMDDTIFELRQFAGGNVATQGAIKPVLTITCNSCGNILFMNAITTGVIRVEQQAAQEPQDQSASVIEETIEVEED